MVVGGACTDFVAYGSRLPGAQEALIRAVYRRRYDADPAAFTPMLVSLSDTQGPVAAAGYRPAHQEPLAADRLERGRRRHQEHPVQPVEAARELPRRHRHEAGRETALRHEHLTGLGLGGGDGDLGMRIIRRTDIDRINVVAGNQCFPIRFTGLVSPLFGKGLHILGAMLKREVARAKRDLLAVEREERTAVVADLIRQALYVAAVGIHGVDVEIAIAHYRRILAEHPVRELVTSTEPFEVFDLTTPGYDHLIPRVGAKGVDQNVVHVDVNPPIGSPSRKALPNHAAHSRRRSARPGDGALPRRIAVSSSWRPKMSRSCAIRSRASAA